MTPQSKQDPDDARDIKVADEVIARDESKPKRFQFSVTHPNGHFTGKVSHDQAIRIIVLFGEL